MQISNIQSYLNHIWVISIMIMLVSFASFPAKTPRRTLETFQWRLLLRPAPWPGRSLAKSTARPGGQTWCWRFDYHLGKLLLSSSLAAHFVCGIIWIYYLSYVQYIYIHMQLMCVCIQYTHTSTYNCRWPFQEPKLEVPTIYKAYIRPKFQGISPQNMARHMVLMYLHFRILEFPLKLYIPSGYLT